MLILREDQILKTPVLGKPITISCFSFGISFFISFDNFSEVK